MSSPLLEKLYEEFGFFPAIVFFLVMIVTVLTAQGWLNHRAAEKRWDQFVKDHDCKVVSSTVGNTTFQNSVGLAGTKMVHVTSTSHQKGSTIWSCNNGTTYVR